MRSRPAGAPRAAFVVTLGSLLAGASLTACRSEPPAPPDKGVHSLVREVAPGRFVIEDERVVDDASVVEVVRADGSRERLDSPDAFVARLAPADSIAAFQQRLAADSVRGAGGSWNAPNEAPAPAADAARPDLAPGAAFSGGLPLGTLLFYTLAMNAWGPPGYGTLTRSGPPMAYRDRTVRDSSRARRRSFGFFILAGRAPSGYHDARARMTSRSTAPSRGRSGYGRSTWGGRSSGG